MRSSYVHTIRNMTDERRTNRLMVPLTPSERAALESAAQQKGLSLSDYVRQALLGEQRATSQIEQRIAALEHAVRDLQNRLSSVL